MELDIKLDRLGACPLCHSKERVLIFPTKETVCYSCSECNLRYLDPCLGADSMVDAYQSSDQLKEMHSYHDGYYEYGDLNKKTKTRDEFETELKRLEKHSPSFVDKSIYEVGYGNGFFLALAKSRGWQVGGIDSSKQNAVLAKEKFDLDLDAGLFEENIPKDKKYDVVAMLDVIEHQQDPHYFVKEACAMLNPGGLLLLATPNDASFLQWLSTFLYRLSGKNFKTGMNKLYFLEHITYYTAETLSQLLEMNQFESVDAFHSSTDIDKYQLKPWENFVAKIILLFGRIFNMQNRVMVIGKKKS